MSVQCSFYILNRDSPDDSHGLYPHTPGGGLVLDHPPAVGDVICLTGHTSDPADPDGDGLINVTGIWQVVAREWTPAMYGSMSWLSGAQSSRPILLTVMLEPTTGLFAAARYETKSSS